VGIQPSGASLFRFTHVTYAFEPDLPEPTTILLFGSGLIGMGVRVISRRRRKSLASSTIVKTRRVR
jgi:hypothetical protein